MEDPNYIIETLDNYPSRLLTFLKSEVNQQIRSLNFPYSTPLSRYLNMYNIVEMHLDHILRCGDDSKLPNEVNSLFFYTFFFIIVSMINLGNVLF